MEREVLRDVPKAEGLDAVVFAVGHLGYADLEPAAWLGGATPLVFDANAVLSLEQRRGFREAGCRLAGIGRGDDCE
jgi:hypothetical protein